MAPWFGLLKAMITLASWEHSKRREENSMGPDCTCAESYSPHPTAFQITGCFQSQQTEEPPVMTSAAPAPVRGGRVHCASLRICCVQGIQDKFGAWGGVDSFSPKELSCCILGWDEVGDKPHNLESPPCLIPFPLSEGRKDPWTSQGKRIIVFLIWTL